MLSISQTMPGLNSVNIAILMGDRLRGALGAWVAAIGLLLPGALIVLAIGFLYGANSDHPMANHVLGGIAAAAAALLTTVTWNLGERTFKKRKSLVLLVLTFVLMSIVKWPLYLVLGIVLPLGLFIYRPSASRQSGTMTGLFQLASVFAMLSLLPSGVCRAARNARCSSSSTLISAKHNLYTPIAWGNWHPDQHAPSSSWGR
jgi:chromate transporter